MKMKPLAARSDRRFAFQPSPPAPKRRGQPAPKRKRGQPPAPVVPPMELGHAIMLLAGGRNFVKGEQVRQNDRGQAAKAARFVEFGGWTRGGRFISGRGKCPCDSSLDEAASAATEAVVEALPSVSFALYGCLGAHLSEVTGDDIWKRADVRGFLCGVASRAAYRVFNRDFAAQSGASIGRLAANQPEGVPLALDAGQIATAVASLSAHFATADIGTQEATRGDRARCHAMSARLWTALVPVKLPGANNQRARIGAVRRARFLIRLVHGQSWADAARLAGYKDSAAASKALPSTFAAIGKPMLRGLRRGHLQQ